MIRAGESPRRAVRMTTPQPPVAADSIRVLFLLQRPESWSNVREVCRRMVADPRFSASVWVLPYDVRRGADNAAIVRTSARLLDAESVEYRIWDESGDFDLRSHDVVVFTAPYDIERPPSLHFDVVARHVPITAYVPYGLVVGGGRKNHLLQYSQPTQAGATMVFARSWAEKSMYREYCPTGDSHVFVTGLPRLDDACGLGSNEVDGDLIQAIGGRFAVLWNSHFSIGSHHRGSLDYSTFDRIAGQLFDYAAENRDVALIWRPHPHLMPLLVSEGLIAQSQMDGLRRDLCAAGIVLDERHDHRHAFAASNALITDAGSFLIEYLMTGKPMAYLQNPDGPGLTDEASELAGRLPVARDAAAAIAFIEHTRHQSPTDWADLGRLRSDFLPMQDGGSARRIVESIASFAAASRPGGRERLTFSKYPALFRLTESLRDMRHSGDAKSSWFARARGVYRNLRVEVVESIKRRPRVLRTLTRMMRR